jgi:hypothetical protein
MIILPAPQLHADQMRFRTGASRKGEGRARLPKAEPILDVDHLRVDDGKAVTVVVTSGATITQNYFIAAIGRRCIQRDAKDR